MPNLIRSLLIAVLALSSAVVAAQPAAPVSPPVQSPFQAAYTKGDEYFRAKDYARARAEYMTAYGINQHPTVVFAIAQTYKYEGNLKEAIAWYRKYIEDSQAAQDLRLEAENNVKELEERQKELDKPKSGPTMPPVPPTEIKPADPKPAPSKPVAEGERKRRIPLGSKIAAGVTGVGLVSALVFTKIGLDAEADLKNNPNATQKDADKVERDQNLINISWGITGAAAITSVVLYFAAPSYSTDSRQISIVPNRDGGMTAAFSTRF